VKLGLRSDTLGFKLRISLTASAKTYGDGLAIDEPYLLFRIMLAMAMHDC